MSSKEYWRGARLACIQGAIIGLIAVTGFIECVSWLFRFLRLLSTHV